MKRTFLVLVLIALFATASFAWTDAEVEEAAAAEQNGQVLTPEQKRILNEYSDWYATQQPQVRNTGGPDGGGYIFKDSEEVDGPTYNWYDISGTGTSIQLDMGDDSTTGPYPIGFSFPFYDSTFTDFYVGSNGAINFDGEYISLSNYNMPSISEDGHIALFHDDLDPADATDAETYYGVVNDGTQDILVISCINWDEYPGNTDPTLQESITAQYQLFADGTIQLMYQTVEDGIYINSCTIGIQNPTRDTGLSVLYNNSMPDYPYDNLAIRFEQLTADASLNGTITDSNTLDPLEGAVVSVMGMTDTTDVAGFYEFTGLYSGTSVMVTASKDGYYSAGAEVSLVSGANTQDLALDPVVPLYTGDFTTSFEASGAPFISDNPEWEWGMPTAGPGAAHDGVNVWATTLGGNHGDTGGDEWLISASEFEISGTSPVMQYYHWFDYNDNFDGYNVQISTDGGTTWNILYPEIGYSGFCSYGAFTDQPVFYNDEVPPTPGELEWAKIVFDLSAYTGQNVKFAFRHIASTVVSYYGVAVDEFAVYQEDPRLLVSGTVTDAISGNPLENVNISLDGLATTSDALGNYSFNVDPGTYTLTATLTDYFDFTTDVTVVDTDLTVDFTMTPLPTADLEGYVTHALYDYPVEGATVAVGDSSTTTDANGYYMMTGLYTSWDQIMVTDPDFPDYMEAITLVDGANTFDVAMTPYLADLDLMLESGASIPDSGGTVVYDIYVENNTPQTRTGDLWSTVQLPNGNTISLWNLDNFTFLTGYAFGNNLSITVPPGAPAGQYTVMAMMGNRPNFVAADDMFMFTKEAPLAGIASTGDAKLSGTAPVLVGPMVSGEAETVISALPEEYELGQAYPNPFNPSANITVSLPDAADLTVRVFNVMGQQVAEVVDARTEAGVHTFTIDGSALSSGIYFIQAQVPGELNAIQKVTLMK